MNNNITILDFAGNEPANDAYKLMRAGYSIYLFGLIGTGKSTLINIMLKERNASGVKKAIVLSSHKIYSRDFGSETYYSRLNIDRETSELSEFSDVQIEFFKDIALIILNEVSTISGNDLDNIDTQLKKIRNNNKPYGGIQIVFVGDHFVYKPFTKFRTDKYGDKKVVPMQFFFESRIFRETSPLYISLQICYSNIDRELLEFMIAIRMKENTPECFTKLKKVIQKNKLKKVPFKVQLTKSTKDAARINEIHIREVFSAIPCKTIAEERKLTERIKRILDFCDDSRGLISSHICTEIGTQVIFTKDDPEGNYQKGSIGKITRHKFILAVKLASGKDVIAKYIDGRFHCPIRICRAMNICRSHRVSFEHVEYELSSKWSERGIVHCALTRCLSLNSLEFSRAIHINDITVSDCIFDFDKMIKSRGALDHVEEALADVMQCDSAGSEANNGVR